MLIERRSGQGRHPFVVPPAAGGRAAHEDSRRDRLAPTGGGPAGAAMKGRPYRRPADAPARPAAPGSNLAKPRPQLIALTITGHRESLEIAAARHGRITAKCSD